MLYGYAREGGGSAALREQVDALLAAGCSHVFQETDARKRPQLALALQAIGFGDVLCVVRLDRLARSAADLLALYRKITENGAGLRSLSEPITDPATPEGRYFPTFAEWFAAFDHATFAERMGDGRRRAREQGRHMGPRKKLTDEQEKKAAADYADGKSMLEIAARFRVSVPTISRALKRAELPNN